MFVCECSSCFWENKRSPALCSKVSLGNGCLCGTGRILGGPEDGPDGAWFHKRIKTQTWAICLVVLKAEPSKELEIMTTKPHNLWSWALIRSAVSQPNVSLFCFLGVLFCISAFGSICFWSAGVCLRNKRLSGVYKQPRLYLPAVSIPIRCHVWLTRGSSRLSLPEARACERTAFRAGQANYLSLGRVAAINTWLRNTQAIRSRLKCSASVGKWAATHLCYNQSQPFSSSTRRWRISSSLLHFLKQKRLEAVCRAQTLWLNGLIHQT